MLRLLLGAWRPRSFVRLLALLLVPVIWVAAAETANAATIYGPRVEGSFSTDSPLDFLNINCNVAGYWVVPDAGEPYVKATGDCEQGWGSEVNRAYLGSLTASGGCSLVGGPVDDVEEAWSINLTVPAGQSADLCGPATGIAHICAKDAWGEVSCSDVEFAWPLGPPPVNETPVTACPWGDPTSRPNVGAPVTSGSYVYYPTRFDLTMKVPTGDASPTTWQAYGIYRDNGTAPPARTGGFQNFSHGLTIGPFTATSNQWMDPPSTGDRLVGFGYVHKVAGKSSTLYTDTQFWNGSSGALGANDPATCRFYWGEKVASAANSDTDEPAGAMDGQPITSGNTTEPIGPVTGAVAVGDPCTFDLADPTTWASAGICALVEVVMGMWNTIKGLPGKIWSLFSSGLTALFVPSDGFFDAKYDSMKAAWADTAPGAWVDAVAGFDVPGGGGSNCQGPHVNVDLGGVVMDTYPLEACSGPAATLADVSRLALTLWFAFFGGIACMRAVGSGFNWNPGVGGGGS